MLPDLFAEPAITARPAKVKHDPSATTFDKKRLEELSTKDFIIEAAEFFGDGELEALGPVVRNDIIAAIEAKQSAKAADAQHAVVIKKSVNVGKSAGAGEGLDE